MVIRALKMWMLFFYFLTSAYGAEIQVVVGSDTTAVGANIPVTINIIGKDTDQIDIETFQLGSENIEVSFLHNSVQSSIHIINGRREDHTTVTNVYQFDIQGNEEGIYELPELSVVVNGKRESSVAQRYEIFGTEQSEGFRLEASIAGRTPIYPGQKIDLLYRIFFSENLDLTHKDLPMLEGLEALKKIGEQKVTAYRTGGYTIQEIKQSFEALKPKTCYFPKGVLEGVVYKENFFGEKTYKFPRLRAEAEGEVLEIRPFPAKNKPKSFSGALGNYKMKVKMLSSNELFVGDKIELQLMLIGKGETSSLHPPNLFKQEAFSQHFRLNDLPPAMEMVGSNKVFLIELRPLDDEITEVPVIEYSFFNPQTHQYERLFSQPFPIKVNRLKTAFNQSLLEKAKDDQQFLKQTTLEIEEDVALEAPPPIDILGNIPPNKQNPTWIKQAYRFYQEGEKAQSLAERQIAFNQSLELYTRDKIKKDDVERFYNLANVYYQLGEYSQAIFYYQKASLFKPRWSELRENLFLAQGKNGLKPYQMNALISQEEKRIILLACFVSALIILFFTASTRKIKRRRFGAFIIITLTFAAVLTVYDLYLSPVQAILSKGAFLRRDAGEHYASLSTQPLKAGSIVKVLKFHDQRNWIQIATREGQIGYVLQDHVKMVE